MSENVIIFCHYPLIKHPEHANILYIDIFLEFWCTVYPIRIKKSMGHGSIKEEIPIQTCRMRSGHNDPQNDIKRYGSYFDFCCFVVEKGIVVCWL